MNSTVMTVTPSYAKELLNSNTDNRKLRPSVVSFYANEMLNGNWQLTHQGIAISKNGRLLDGQHRLKAVVEANIPVTMLVFENCEDSIFNMLDIGAKRTMSDVTGIDSKTSSVVSKIISINNGDYTTNSKRVSPKEVLRIYDNNKELLSIVSKLVTSQGFTSSVVVGCLAYYYQNKDYEKINSFPRFMRHGIVSEKMTNSMLYVASNLMRNDSHTNRSILVSEMAYKSLCDDNLKIVRPDKESRKAILSFCKMIVEGRIEEVEQTK